MIAFPVVHSFLCIFVQVGKGSRWHQSLFIENHFVLCEQFSCSILLLKSDPLLMNLSLFQKNEIHNQMYFCLIQRLTNPPCQSYNTFLFWFAVLNICFFGKSVVARQLLKPPSEAWHSFGKRIIFFSTKRVVSFQL